MRSRWLSDLLEAGRIGCFVGTEMHPESFHLSTSWPPPDRRCSSPSLRPPCWSGSTRLTVAGARSAAWCRLRPSSISSSRGSRWCRSAESSFRWRSEGFCCRLKYLSWSAVPEDSSICDSFLTMTVRWPFAPSTPPASRLPAWPGWSWVRHLTDMAELEDCSLLVLIDYERVAVAAVLVVVAAVRQAAAVEK